MPRTLRPRAVARIRCWLSRSATGQPGHKQLLYLVASCLLFPLQFLLVVTLASTSSTTSFCVLFGAFNARTRRAGHPATPRPPTTPRNNKPQHVSGQKSPQRPSPPRLLHACVLSQPWYVRHTSMVGCANSLCGPTCPCPTSPCLPGLRQLISPSRNSLMRRAPSS